MPENEAEHLGDGVYATFDGYHVWLDLRAQDPGIRIALEPAVIDALLAYARRMHAPKPEDLTAS